MGANLLTAHYVGDALNNGADSAPITVTVGQLTPDLALTTSNATPVFGEDITLTAQLTGGSGPQGDISFRLNGQEIGTATPYWGEASFTTSSLPVGVHLLTAHYAGDTIHTEATSLPVTVTVSQITPGLTLTASNPAPVFGSDVTLTARLTGAMAPQGDISFRLDGQEIGTATLSGGEASFTTASLPLGANLLTAHYAGDALHTETTSAALTVTVGQAATTTALALSPNPSMAGQPVTLTASVAVIAPGTGIPGGTVLFTGPGGFAATASLNGAGIAEVATSNLISGAVTATYNGAAAYAGSATQLQMVVEAVEIELYPGGGTLPPAEAGLDYLQQVSASGGQAPYSYRISAGQLPLGLQLNELSGIIAGTPAAAGSSQFSITVTDSYGNSTTLQFGLLVDYHRPDPTNDPEVTGLLNAQAGAARRLADDQITRFGTRLEQLHSEDSRRANSLSFGDLSIWTDGRLSRGDATGEDFTASGISIGMDYRFSERLIAGAGIGYGSDETRIGENGTHSRAEARSAAVYLSYRPLERFFIDALLGTAELDFHAQRYVTASGDFAEGQRSGSQVFGLLTASYEFRSETLLVAPYGGMRFSRSRLHGYQETSGGPYRLEYGEMTTESLAGILGLRAEQSTRLAHGMMTLGARLEYRYSVETTSGNRLGYVDLGGLPYEVAGRRSEGSGGSLGLSLGYASDRDWSLDFDYRATFSAAGATQHGLGATFSLRF